jgi:hypothetical protein
LHVWDYSRNEKYGAESHSIYHGTVAEIYSNYIGKDGGISLFPMFFLSEYNIDADAG